MVYDNILDLIGNTPIVEIKCFDTGLCKLFLKLENSNPGGSIKDRIGFSMIENAEREGKIRPGFTLVEATAGNTGLGLALTAAKKGYKLLLVIPDKMSSEKVAHLKAMGAQIVMTRSDVGKGHPEYYQDLAARLAREIPDAYYINQFNNPYNPLAHEKTTGPEIWAQMDKQVDAVAVGVGSAGTIGGLTAFFKKVKPEVEFILADPAGSVLKDYFYTGQTGEAGSWAVEGIGEDFVPVQCDMSLVKYAYSVTDGEAFETVRQLLMKEGVFAGSSTGVLVSAALKYAKAQKTPKNIVTFACDTGSKYLSKMFSDDWMVDHGFLGKSKKGNLIDIISRLNDDRAVITIDNESTVSRAFSSMKANGISQLPVVDDSNRVIGIIDEYDILCAYERDGESIFTGKVGEYMTADPKTLAPEADQEELVSVLKQGFTAIIADGSNFYGLVTKTDYLNYMKLQYDNRLKGAQNG